VDEFLVECVLVATIDRLFFTQPKLKRSNGGVVGVAVIAHRLTKRACVMTSQTC
jgi:hypothetical protein